MMEKMKPRLKGAGMTFAIEIESNVVKTNSAYAGGNKVTLFDLPIGQWLSSQTLTPEA
jgi:hypothetical protein